MRKHRKSITKVLLVTIVLMASISIVSYAGEWKQDAAGWWYQNDNGGYPVSQWQEINGKQYYFDSNGYMMANTTTPDGYKVGADGAWIESSENKTTPPQNCIDIAFQELNSTWFVDTTDSNYNKNGFSYQSVRIILNNNVIRNQWIHWIYDDGTERWEYRGEDGHALKDGITSDGYQVIDAEWKKTVNQNNQSDDGIHTKRSSDKGIKGDCFIGIDDNHEVMTVEGMECALLNKGEFSFKFPSEKNTITPSGHEIWVVGYVFYNGIPFAIGEPKRYPLEYDKEFTFDYTGKYPTADLFYDYCKREDLLIEVSIVDNEGFGNAIETGQGNALSWYMKYK